MRTTLTLEPDVVERLRRETQNGRISLKKVINERLRIGLNLKTNPVPSTFQVVPHPASLRAGVDPARLNQLVDDLEVEAFAAKENSDSR